MITKIKIENFMQLQNQQIEFGNVNIIAGVNDTGKTSLLKLIYASIKAREEVVKQKKDNYIEYLATKILNVFDIEKLGDLVTKSQESLKVDLFYKDKSNQTFSFSNKAKTTIKFASEFDSNDFKYKTIFLPPKEVLTIRKLIRTTIEQYDFRGGYDDTYYDLVKALDIPLAKGMLSKNFKEADVELEKSLQGRILNDGGEFVFKKNKYKFSISLTAEGVKKIGIINQLLKNKAIDKNSVLIIDELEVALHPTIIQKVAKIIFDLSQAGVQVFIATHSYFVIKSFHLLALENSSDICFFNLKNENDKVEIEVSNLKEGIPQNEIVDSSIKMFEKEQSIKIKSLGI
jgi:AAA15 family ATPase/GTPase